MKPMQLFRKLQNYTTRQDCINALRESRPPELMFCDSKEFYDRLMNRAEKILNDNSPVYETLVCLDESSPFTAERWEAIKRLADRPNPFESRMASISTETRHTPNKPRQAADRPTTSQHTQSPQSPAESRAAAADRT